MTQQDYSKLPVFYDSNAVREYTSINMTTNSGQQRVDLLQEGLAGFTPGSGDTEIELGIVVPIGGPEYNYQQDCATGRFVPFQVGVGRVAFIGMGKVTSVKIGQSVNASTEGTVTWLGEMRPME